MNRSKPRKRKEFVDFFQVANLTPKHTGLPFVVWISTKAGVQCDVCVMVSHGLNVTSSELIFMAIRPDVHVIGRGQISVKDLALLRQWVDLNRDVIIKHWDGVIESTIDALTELKPLR